MPVYSMTGYASVQHSLPPQDAGIANPATPVPNVTTHTLRVVVRAANAAATAGLVPDLTVLLSLPAAEGLARAAARGPSDRMERSGHDFHARVDAAFHSFAARNSWACSPMSPVSKAMVFTV